MLIIGLRRFSGRLLARLRLQGRRSTGRESGSGEDVTDQLTPSHARSSGKRTRHSILEAAKAVFAAEGYSGAHVNEIVARAGTTKPMIYYHFGSKEGLFAAVLEDVYAGMREIEAALNTADKPVEEAMRLLVQVTFDYHAEHPDWVRLISIANIHHAEHLTKSPTVASRNTAVFEFLQVLLARGAAEGVFRSGIDPLHLHLLIISLCFYRVSNRHTWKVIFRRDLGIASEIAAQRAMVIAAVLQFLKPEI